MADTFVRSLYQYSLKTTKRSGVVADFVGAGTINLFLVQNACILVKRIFGRVTTAFTGGVATMLLNFIPVGGVGGTNLCAASAGANHAIDVVLTWSGVVAALLTPSATLGHTAASGTATETFSGSDLIMCPGTIQMTVGGGADLTGVVDWYIQYWPGAQSALVTAM